MANGTEGDDRDALLAENRARRAQIRADEAEKARRKGDSDGATEETTAPAATDPAVTDTESTAPSATPPASTGRGPVKALGAAVVVLLIAVGVLGYLLARSGSEDSALRFDASASEPSNAEEQVVTDAKKYAVTVLTYSSGEYSDLDKRIRAISTPEFADRYIKSSQSARVGNDEAKAKGTAEAKDAGLISISDSKAVVLVAVDQTVTSPLVPSAGSDGMQYQSRLRISLDRDGDEWKISDLSVV